MWKHGLCVDYEIRWGYSQLPYLTFLFEYSLWINIAVKPGVNISLQPTLNISPLGMEHLYSAWSKHLFSTCNISSAWWNISSHPSVNISLQPGRISPKPGIDISSQPDENISPNPVKDTQDWEFFWLRIWILYYFIVSSASILRFCKKNFLIGPWMGEIRLFHVVWY